MKIIMINNFNEMPANYTGIAQRPEGKFWFKDDKCHREDGPAIEWTDGSKSWFLEEEQYLQINLKDFVILGYDKGGCGLMWYKLLDKDRIFEYPDIPGLITK